MHWFSRFINEADKQISCDLAYDRFVKRTDEVLKAALRRYQAGEYRDPSDYAFEGVTPADAEALSDRHEESILDILQRRAAGEEPGPLTVKLVDPEIHRGSRRQDDFELRKRGVTLLTAPDQSRARLLLVKR